MLEYICIHDYIIYNEWMDTNGISFIHDLWKRILRFY